MKGYRPESFDELWEVLKIQDYIIVNGATDAGVWLERGKVPSENLVFISDISEMKSINEEDGNLIIGASCTMNEIANNGSVKTHCPALSMGAGSVGSYQIRNMATIGGNIINSSPAGDTLPSLYAMDAKVVLRSQKGERIIDIKEFIKGPGKNLLDKGEILYKVIVPFCDDYITVFEKIGSRGANAISKASLTVLYKKEGSFIKDIRIALGAVGPTIVRAKKLEDELINKNSDELLGSIIDRYFSEEVHPINDIRSTEEYRREVLSDLLKHNLLA